MLGLDQELVEKVDKFQSVFSRVFRQCLKVKDEEILIISDYGERDNQLAAMIGYGYYSAALKKGLKARILFQDVKKGFMRADENVIRALQRIDDNTVVILSLSNKLGRMGGMGKSFRKFCKEKECRFISASGLGGVNSTKFDIFMEAVNVNYSRMRKHGQKIKNKLDRAKIIVVTTEAGTEITFDISGMKAVANTGDYREKGKGGNIPAGEVYIPPKGLKGVNGVVVINGSMRCDEGTKLLSEPLKLYIEEGRIIRIEGMHKALLEQTLVRREDRAKFPERVRLIGELGIGINSRAVLTGNSVLDEKVLGTAHVAIGSNSWFGGDIRTILHLDQVFMNPKIYLDGKELKV